jgi:hypothetical protein
MAIATRPKPKVQHKKRKAQHHRQTSSYLKPYWPYLPMLAIVGLGMFVNNHWPEDLRQLTNSLALSDQPVTRIEAITGNQNGWALLIIISMATIAAAIFIFQHWFRVKRLLNQGERFIVKHPWLDITLVLVCTAGVVLTRTN